MPDFAVATHFTVQEQLTQFFAKGERAANSFASQVNAAFNKSGKSASLFKNILSGVTIGNLASAGISKIGTAIQNTVQQLPEFAEKFDAISKTSRAIGVSVEGLQRFQYAAGMDGVATEQLTKSFQVLNNQLALQKSHQGTLYTTMAKLNPELAKQLYRTKDSQQAFLIVAESIKKATSAQQRAAIAQAAFGKSGQEMLPFLLEGKKGISELMAEASKYGNIIDTKTAVAAEHFNDTLSRFNRGIDSVKYSVLSTLMTAVIPYMDKGAEWIAQNKNIIATGINNFISNTTKFLQQAIPVVKEVVGLVKEFGPPILAAVVAYNALKISMIAAANAGMIFKTINTIMFAYQAYAGGAATAQEALNMVMNANPVGLIITGVSILVGLFALLASRVGGVQNAFMVIGQTIMKFLLTPINYLIAAWTKVIGLLSHIPGLSGLKGVADSISGAQAAINETLTGSSSYGFQSLADPYKNARAAEVARKAPNEAEVQRSESNFTGVLQIAGAPQGSTMSTKQTGNVRIRTDMMGVNP